MKIRFGWIVVLIIFVGLGIYIYKFFNDGDYFYKHSNYEFTMNVKDIVNIDDEIYIKYNKVIDNKCRESNCERDGEKIAKLIVINNPYIDFIDLSSINYDEVSIKKSDYKINLVNYNEDDYTITIKVVNE